MDTLDMYPFSLDLTEKHLLTLDLIDMYIYSLLILPIFLTLNMHSFTLDYEVPFGT